MKKIYLIVLLLAPLISFSQASKIISSQAVPKNVIAPNLVWVDLGDTLTGGGGQYRFWLGYPDSLKIKSIQVLWLRDTTQAWGDLRYAQLLGAYTNPPFVNSLSAGKVFGLSSVATSGAYSDLSGLPNLSLYYLASNPSGYISGITSGMVTAALGYTPYNSSNPSNYITASALSPYYLASNPNGYISSVPAQTFASLTGKPTTLSGYGITDATSNARTSISLTTTGTGAASYNNSTGVLNIPTPTTGTVTSVGLSSTDFSVSGSPVTSSGSIIANLNTSGVSAGSYNGTYTVTTKGIVTAANNKSQSIVARTLGTSFQVSTTKAADVNYSVLISLVSVLAGNAGGTVQLQISSDNVTFNTASTSGYSVSGLVSTASNTQTLSAYVPAAYWVKIVYTASTSGLGSSSTGTYQTGQEVLY